MDVLHVFPHLNALLNASAGVFLVCGFVFIVTKRVHAHRFCMVSACILSLIFLVSYVTHHALRSYYFGIGPTAFTGTGLVRPVYFTILTSHTILAVILGPFVIATLYRALKGRFDEHKRLARLVFPVWLYVSITGVIVYLMLYQIYSPK